MGTKPYRVFLKDGVFRGSAVTGHPCRILTHCATRWSSRARELRGGTAAGLRDRLHGLAEVAPSARHESGVSRF
jgi:hypothetical protein